MNNLLSWVVIAIILTLCLPVSALDRAKEWEAVQKAKNDGLPKTAIEKLNPIIESAISDQKFGEALKALCEKIVLEGNIQGNKAEEKVTRLESEIEKADPFMRPLMQVVLARWYWHYYQQNKWRFLNRSATSGFNEKDFTTWDLPKLFQKVGGLLDEVLANDATLKSIPITDFDDFLTHGNLSVKLRPTLFDFISHQALEFYCSGEQAAAKPQDSFEFEATGAALGEVKEFLAWVPMTEDKDSPKLKAVLIFQKLLKFCAETGNTDALIDNDILRLNWAKNAAVGEEAGDRYIEKLKALANEYAANELSSLALFFCAQEQFNRGRKTEAHKTANEGYRRFPNSAGGNNCKGLIVQIESKTLGITIERVIGFPLPKIKVDYTNIDRIHFKLVAFDWRDLLRKERYSPEYLDWNERDRIIQREPFLEWSGKLPTTPDFQMRTELLDFPEVKPGFYFLVASWKAGFPKGQNAVNMAPVWVSSLAIISRTRAEKIEGMVFQNETGEPISGAKIDGYSYDYNSGWNRAVQTTTDQDGRFEYRSPGKNILAVAQANGEILFDSDSLSTYSQSRPHPHEQVFFFTDRAIYRPGQTIHFKAIIVRVDQTNDSYQIVKNRSVAVSFRDPNGQEVSRLNLTSNDFGSFSGDFTAPTDRLTGAMSLVSQGPNGSAQVRVEEYKRPKFKVSLELPTEGGKLGKELVVKGEAMAYTGAAIDNAMVKFRVVREVRMPWWWCWWGAPPKNDSAEISHGVLKTDSSGKFQVKFVPKPDLKVPEKDNPTFVFKITADVTDSTGETRSSGQSVRLGYVSLDLNLSSSKWLDSSQPVQVSINTATLDGKGVPAKTTLLVHSLKAPEKPERPSLYGQAKPDLSNPASWDLGQVVSEESITTDANGSGQAKFSLKPGAYRVIGKTSDRFGKELQSPLELIVFEPTSKQFPVKVPNMFLTQSDSVEVGDTFRAIWGTGYSKGRAYIEIEHRNNLLKAYWTNEGKTQALIEIPVSEDMRGGFTVHVTQVRENRAFLESRHVNVPWSNKDLSLSFSHFTSKMQPAQKETWMIKIKGPGAEMKAVEMAATLYDASLDAYAPHSWLAKFGFFRTDYSTAWKHFANRARPLENIYYDWNEGWGAQSRIYYQFPHEININFGGYGYYTESEEGLGGMGVERKAEGRGAPMPAMSPSMQMADSMVSEKESNKSAKREKLSYADEAPGAAHPPSESRGDAAQEPTPDLSKVSARTNLNETAFFFPHLAVEGDGAVNMTFTMPEALTTWKFLGFTHGLNCESGGLLGETITQKDFMVQPNPPRFLREGDELVFTAKVTNLSESRQKGKIRLSLRDATNDNSRDSAFGLSAPDLDFDVPPKESRSVGWKLIVPDGPGIIAYKVVAASGKLSDGEEAMLPVLSRRIFVTESLPLPIRGPATKGFKFQKLLDSSKSSTLVTQSLTVQVTSNPAWYAVQALPYLMEFPHECSEQLFNRFYANSLARFISNSDPRIRKVFDAWKADEALGGKALLSNLEKNEQLKSVLLLETPWVRQAKSETQAKHNVGVLFDSNRLEDELGRATKKLGAMQLSDGSWPWFPGGRGDSFITLYITTGFGRLRHLGVDVDVSMAIRAINHLDSWINEVYQEILRHGFRDRNNLSSTIAIYLYGRGFFLKEKPIPSSSKEAVDYFLGQGSQYWLKLDSRLSQGHLALGLQRFGDNATPKKIGASMKERSVTDEELGRFWRDTELSWWWYRAPIETQAVMIEVFDEVMHDEESVEDCKVWLLKQKQTQDWKTTKATADAIYALLLKGAKLLASEKLVKISLAGNEVKPEKIEAGTGFYEKRFAGNEVKPQMGEISMTKEDKGVAWGGVHWQYLEDMSKVTPHETNLKLKKTLFVKKDSSKGPVISPLANNKLSVGDLLVVRIELRTDRDMEYVHMKDQRGSGLEPTDVLSCYKYQDGLAYYQSTKDTASHFYIDYLPKGVYVFEYNLRVQHKGRYQTGMAEIQCMYAPEFGSHSESFLLEIAE